MLLQARDRNFDATSDVADFTLDVNSVAALQSRVWDEFRRRFNDYGAVILSIGPTEHARQDLLDLKPLFGDAWQHARADADGIAVIEPSGDQPKYLGTTNEVHPPHTDGAYSDRPPPVLAMYCEHPSDVGGDTVLISGANIFAQLSRLVDAAALDALFEPDAITITRDQESSCGPLFTRVKGRIRMRFRMDDKATVTPIRAAQRGFDAFQGLVMRRENQLVTRLKAGELLVIDNTALLHARTSFPEGMARKLYRLNLCGRPDGDFEFGFKVVGDPTP